ncbi:MAG: ABC transporter ATP-binding protein [Chloroflexi bacterium]|nr:ABC transporter ATP-binding protein [Chloroflexota bacterium]
MLARPLPDTEHALVVRNITKYFHLPGPPIWKRLLGAKSELPTSDDLPSVKSGDKEPVVAVDHVSFDIKRGEIFGVLGPNGSGKSTLIRLISTLLKADKGSAAVFGIDIEKHDMAVKQLISRVSVDAAFFKKLSPMENLLYGARLYGVTGPEATVKAYEIMSRLGLKKSSYDEPMEEMSRGMQQKVAVARAFLTSPILLLLDEPTTGLDPRSKREVHAFIEELRDAHDATILITTHDMDEADTLCDRVSVIHNGKLVATDTPANLKRSIARNGVQPTLEDVFMVLTGEQLVDRDTMEAPLPK